MFVFVLWAMAACVPSIVPQVAGADSEQVNLELQRLREQNRQRAVPFIWNVREWRSLSPKLTRFGLVDAYPWRSSDLGRALPVYAWIDTPAAIGRLMASEVGTFSSPVTTDAVRLLAFDFAGVPRLAYLSVTERHPVRVFFALGGVEVTGDLPDLLSESLGGRWPDTEGPWVQGEFRR